MRAFAARLAELDRRMSGGDGPRSRRSASPASVAPSQRAHDATAGSSGAAEDQALNRHAVVRPAGQRPGAEHGDPSDVAHRGRCLPGQRRSAARGREDQHLAVDALRGRATSSTSAMRGGEAVAAARPVRLPPLRRRILNEHRRHMFGGECRRRPRGWSASISGTSGRSRCAASKAASRHRASSRPGDDAPTCRPRGVYPQRRAEART